MANEDWTGGSVSPEEAVASVKSGMRIFVHGAAATPTPLLEALAKRTDLENVRLYHLHLDGPCAFADPEHEGRFLSVSLFTGPPLRKPIEEGRADFMPIFLSDIPRLFSSGRIPLDMAFLQLSPPDRHGFCSLGVSVNAAKAAADSARMVVAEVNERMPRTHGHTAVPFHRLSSFIHTDRPLHEHLASEETVVERNIGATVADLVEDGSTLQLGIGAIPDAVAARLGGKNDLGVHTEMFSDGVMELIRTGVVTNRYKKVHTGRTVTSFVMGSERLYDFVDDNHALEFHPCHRTNDTHLIRQNPKVVAVNSAIQIDLSGQVCADSMGHRIFSGIGGQMDFIHGAALSPGGKPIVAIPSTARRGTVSRIVPALTEGAGVVTTRGHVHWVVTEYGAVNLHGMTLRERAAALITIAHPDFRGDLQRSLKGIRHIVPSTPSRMDWRIPEE